MTHLEMLAFLKEFYEDKAVMRQRHAAAAAYVPDYDFNNTYQYIIAREDMHLRWLIDAITDLGEQPGEPPAVSLTPTGRRAEAQRSIIAADHEAAERFLGKWLPRVEALPNARHRTLLKVILGETEEHRRFFDLALAGRTDLLGRRADGAGTVGDVLPTRWVGGDRAQ